MTQIWKYELKAQGEYKVDSGNSEAIAVFHIPMPQGAYILPTIQEQNRMPVIWAEVDPAAPKFIRVVEIYYSGKNINLKSRRYIGTCQMPGAIALHAYESPPGIGDVN